MNLQEQEGSKLIADFVGWVHHSDREYDSYEMRNTKYHSSWDALMPAISKFNLLDSSPGFEDLPSEYYHIRIKVDSAVTTYCIAEAFKVFVTAIEWYNENKV